MKNEEYTNDNIDIDLTNTAGAEKEITPYPLDASDSQLDAPEESLPLEDEYTEESIPTSEDENPEESRFPIDGEFMDEALLLASDNDAPLLSDIADDASFEEAADRLGDDEDLDRTDPDDACDDEDGDDVDTDETGSEEATDADTGDTNASEEKIRRVDTIFDFMEIAIFSILGMFMLLSFFFRYTVVDGGSMMNTLQNEERLLLTNFLYTPDQGDIVVVHDKSTYLQKPIVKRVIAVGGQTVKVTRNAIYVDTILLDEPYVYTGDYVNSYGGSGVYRYSIYPSEELLADGATYVEGLYYEIYVPEGYLFLMGDHRNNSTDSRDIGLVHEDAVIGKAIYRFFPFDKIGKIE